MPTLYTSALTLSLITLLSCASEQDSEVTERQQLVLNVQPQEIENIDLLFVIDDSNSMTEEQEGLAKWAETFLFGSIGREEVGQLSLHIAVTTTSASTGSNDIPGCDMSRQGVFNIEATDSCMPPDGNFIIDLNNGDGTRTENFQSGLGEVFRCIAKVGTNGCGFEQPLEAMRSALDGSIPNNEGFLRDDALLAVIIVSDEDDCSASDKSLFGPDNTQLGRLTSFRCFEQAAICDQENLRSPGTKTNCYVNDDSLYLTPVQEYADFLYGLKQDPNMVVVAGILGDTSSTIEVSTHSNDEGQEFPILAPSCQRGEFEQAKPAIRLVHFLNLFPTRNQFASICEATMQGPLSSVASVVNAVSGRSMCLSGPIDIANGGSVCSVSKISADNTETKVTACLSSEDTNCYTIRTDTAHCNTTQSQLALQVRQANSDAQQERLIVRCTPKAVL